MVAPVNRLTFLSTFMDTPNKSTTKPAKTEAEKAEARRILSGNIRALMRAAGYATTQDLMDEVHRRFPAAKSGIKGRGMANGTIDNWLRKDGTFEPQKHHLAYVAAVFGIDDPQSLRSPMEFDALSEEPASTTEPVPAVEPIVDPTIAKAPIREKQLQQDGTAIINAMKKAKNKDDQEVREVIEELLADRDTAPLARFFTYWLADALRSA